MTEEELGKAQNIIDSLKDSKKQIDEIPGLKSIAAGRVFRLKVNRDDDYMEREIQAPFCLVKKWLDQLENYYQERMETLKKELKNI